MTETKRCGACKEEKPLDEFYKNKRGGKGRSYYCKICQHAYNRKHYAENLERSREYTRNWYKKNPDYERERKLKSRFGLTIQDWEILFDSQGRVCALCKSDNPRSKQWATDHCHETGRVRGILCWPCNLLLGYVEKGYQLPSKLSVKYYLEEENVPDA